MRRSQDVRLAGPFLGRYRHICAFVGGRDEGDRVLLPLIKEGVARGDRVFQTVERRHADHVGNLEAAGIGIDDIRRTEQMGTRRVPPGEFPRERQGRRTSGEARTS